MPPHGSSGGDSPTARALAAAVLDRKPSKESLDALSTLYTTFLDEKSSDANSLLCLQEMDDLQLLEDALWPLAPVVATVRDCRHHVKRSWVVSVLLLVSFKARVSSGADVGNGVWGFLKTEDGCQAWKIFMTTLWTLLADAEDSMEDDAKWTLKEQLALTQFLITCFENLDVQEVATSVLPLTSLPLWTALSPTQRALEFLAYPKLERHWNRVMNEAKSSVEKKQSTKQDKRRKLETATDTLVPGQTALVQSLQAFFRVVKAPVDDDVSNKEIAQRLRFVALFLALLIDLLNQLPTRRFLLTVLRRRHVRSVLRNSPLVQHALQWQSAYDRQALNQQLMLLNTSLCFPIDPHTGKSLSPREYRERQMHHIQSLQQRAFHLFRNSRLDELAIAPCGHIMDPSRFTEMLSGLAATDRQRLAAFGVAVGVFADEAEADATSNAELVDYFKEEYSICAPPSNSPIFPTELNIWAPESTSHGDEFAVEEVYGADETNLFPVLAIPKLGLQYLDTTDYLQRNYELLRLESAHNIRSDLEVAVKQLDVVRSLRSTGEDDSVCRGFSRTAVPLAGKLQIVKVSKPALGQTYPACIRAQLEVELSSRHDHKQFDCYQTKEVVFLLAVRATADEGAELLGFDKHATSESTKSFPEKFGVQYVRTAEIVEVVDAAGKPINDENPVGKGSKRVFTLAFDGMQYKKDLAVGQLEAYERVNVLVRRKPRANNFKAILETTAAACNDSSTEELLPAWLHDLFLGYGDPAAALYKTIYKTRAEKQVVVPMNGLLVDGEHALEAGGVAKLMDAADQTQSLDPKDAMGPFTYVENMHDGKSIILAHQNSKTPSSHPSRSPIRLTKSQVRAVRTGMCDGLTLVVGPPGTGKTDVAVQLVLNLYRSTPAREKILIVAHSNQALNDFFAKILAQDVINEAEIVRLGLPQLANDDGADPDKSKGAFHSDFSRNGRVAFLLGRRAALLGEVELMAQWLLKRDAAQYAGLAGGSASYSCENALIFYKFHMKAHLVVACGATAFSSVALTEYFRIRKGSDPDQIEALQQFARDIESYFTELRRLQPFELLQTGRQRGDLYLIHHARIVAMTCTHAALNYRKLTGLGLTFGSLIMEEAAQVSELDSFVPLLLACSKKVTSLSQESSFSPCLKRVVLLGDSKQLPPVVKSLALKNYAHFDQSLFTRLLRLGVPHVALDRQGRSRTELVDIYRWRYDYNSASEETSVLGDLPRVALRPEYQTGNVGFAHVAQFVDLATKERQTRPFAFENEGEARFIVALFRYMLAVGYCAENVTILTTYTAQKELLQRLLRADVTAEDQHCKVSTVDSFQGQQNDFILLSTVRTGATVGHLRDERRATTAFSRARLGLYVVGSRTTLEQARELQPFLTKLIAVAKKRPTTLALLPSERVKEKANTSKGPTKTSVMQKDIKYISDLKQLEKIITAVYTPAFSELAT
ncbi:hypothetical protein PHYBOEH_011099 [Phytophthora boehmeriae]|uniref:Intron-binding protein aquarius n=1 Tax=Phytophthora boehmeriae TaxID=109152 RepID=A0A8T1X1W1_9STRA|nr:hypothetical protein PHYBOEH_011099 [Phytophthora boehmeriae]